MYQQQQQPVQQNNQNTKQIYADYQKVLKIFSDQGIGLDGAAKQDIYNNFLKQTPEQRQAAIQKLSELDTANKVLADIGIQPETITTSVKAQEIVNTSIEELAQKMAEQIKKANSVKYPKTLEEFITKITQNKFSIKIKYYFIK